MESRHVTRGHVIRGQRGLLEEGVVNKRTDMGDGTGNLRWNEGRASFLEKRSPDWSEFTWHF